MAEISPVDDLSLEFEPEKEIPVDALRKNMKISIALGFSLFIITIVLAVQVNLFAILVGFLLIINVVLSLHYFHLFKLHKDFINAIKPVYGFQLDFDRAKNFKKFKILVYLETGYLREDEVNFAQSIGFRINYERLNISNPITSWLIQLVNKTPFLELPYSIEIIYDEELPGREIFRDYYLDSLIEVQRALEYLFVSKPFHTPKEKVYDLNLKHKSSLLTTEETSYLESLYLETEIPEEVEEFISDLGT